MPAAPQPRQHRRVGVQIREHAAIDAGRIVVRRQRLVGGAVDHAAPVVGRADLNAELQRAQPGRHRQPVGDALIDRRAHRPARGRRPHAGERARVERLPGEHPAHARLVAVAAAASLFEAADHDDVRLVRLQGREDRRQREVGLARAGGRGPGGRDGAVRREHHDEARDRRGGGARAAGQHRLQPGQGDRRAARPAQDGPSGQRVADHGEASGGRLRNAAIRTVARTILRKSPPGPPTAAASRSTAQRSPIDCSARPKA